jgi:hypothetical protein
MLQRPPTIKEFVIQSILGRDVADTLVDPEERASDVDLVPPPPRPSQDSIVFDLLTPPR